MAVDRKTDPYLSLIARARDEFFEGAGKYLLTSPAHGVYLRNRIEAAFIAGWMASENSEDADHGR